MSINVERTKIQMFDLIVSIKSYIRQAKKHKEKTISYTTDKYDMDIVLGVKTFFEDDEYIISLNQLQPKTFQFLIKWR